MEHLCWQVTQSFYLKKAASTNYKVDWLGLEEDILIQYELKNHFVREDINGIYIYIYIYIGFKQT